jgi:methylisocitrate lyase
LPVSIDLESGYGATPAAVRHTVGLALEAGAVGCNLEDSVPADGTLRGISDQSERIRAARRSADETNIRFFINARTDVFLREQAERHDNSMVDETIKRARAYADAGADGIFAPGLVTLALIARLAEASPLPLNLMVVDTTPPVSTLADHGVARLSHGPGPYLVTMKALEEAVRAWST